MSSWKKSILELHRCVEVSIHFPFQLWISLHVLWAEFLGKKGSLHVRSFTNSTFLVSTIFLSPHNVFGKYILSYFSFSQPQQSNSPPLCIFFFNSSSQDSEMQSSELQIAILIRSSVNPSWDISSKGITGGAFLIYFHEMSHSRRKINWNFCHCTK